MIDGVQSVPKAPRSKVRWPLAFSASIRLIGWMPSIGSAVALGVGLLLARTIWVSDPSLTPRVVETVVPLVFGLQSAFLLCADSDPPLELVLSCPRPLSWLISERFMVLVVLQGSVGLAGMCAASIGYRGAWLIAAMRWLAPGLFIGGAAFFTAQVTRQGAFGALRATLLWGGMLFGGDAMLARFPYLWPLHLYIQPDSVTPAVYGLNRATLIAGGLLLIVLGAYLAHDEERMLGMRPG
jgi:hypothetical protein